MAEIINFPEPGVWGDCPHCKRNDGYLNIGKEQWFICHRHKVKWLAGLGVLSSWMEESEQVWSENAWRLSFYREVESVNR